MSLSKPLTLRHLCHLLNNTLGLFYHHFTCGARGLKGEDRFPVGPRALLRWFQSGRNRLGGMKKACLFRNWHGSVMVKAVVYEAQGGEDRFPLGPRALLRWSQSGRKRIRKL